MKTALIIIAITLVVSLALFFLARKLLKQIAYDMKQGRETAKSAKEMAASAKIIEEQTKCTNLLLQKVQPGKMYDTLQELMPQLRDAVNGINAMQDELRNHSSEIKSLKTQGSNHEDRIKFIEEIIHKRK